MMLEESLSSNTQEEDQSNDGGRQFALIMCIASLVVTLIHLLYAIRTIPESFRMATPQDIYEDEGQACLELFGASMSSSSDWPNDRNKKGSFSLPVELLCEGKSSDASEVSLSSRSSNTSGT